MVTESAEVELAVATAVAVDVFLRFVPLLATKPGAALKVVQWPSLSQITAGELLWYRRGAASAGNPTRSVKATIVITFMLSPRFP
jgi:hypothetical protein